jgi:hypothetical protein
VEHSPPLEVNSCLSGREIPCSLCKITIHAQAHVVLPATGAYSELDETNTRATYPVSVKFISNCPLIHAEVSFLHKYRHSPT